MSLADAIAANQRAVIAMSEPHLREMMRVLEEVRDEISETVRSLLRDSTRKYTTHAHRATMLQLDDAIKLAEERLPIATVSDLARGAKKASSESLRRLKSMVSEGEKLHPGAIGGLRLDAARVIATTSKTLTHRHAHAGSRYAGRVGQRIRRDLAVGIIRGESVGEIARRLAGSDYTRARNRGPGAVADAAAENQFFRNVSDAERLVRTELVNAYSVTQIEALREADEDDPGYLKMWDGKNDMRICSACFRLNGTVVSIDDPFPGGVWHPPLHPRDRCAVVPWHRGWGTPPKI